MMGHPPPSLQPSSERVSQLLPTVKCSTCSNLVPISDLGDHACSRPPLPPTPVSATTLFLNRTSPLSPAALERKLIMPHPVDRLPAALLPRGGETVRVRTLSNARKSPSTTDPTVSVSHSRPIPPPLSRVQPPLRSTSKLPPTPTNFVPFPTQRDATSPRPPDLSQNQSHRPSLSSIRGYNASPRPSILYPGAPSNKAPPSLSAQPPGGSNTRAPFATANGDRVPPNVASPTQYYSEGNIDTITGGEAGMAGVGRRGFAAAVRAAMFTPSYQRRGDPPRFLDIDAATRARAVTMETPPLSASSSHSAGYSSPFPQTPSTPDPNIIQPPSPGMLASKMPIPAPLAIKGLADVPTTPTTPTAATSPTTRMPFFEKFRNKIPGAHVLAGQDLIYETNGPTNSAAETPSTAVPVHRSGSASSNVRRRLPPPPSEADTASNYGFSPPSRTTSLSSTKSRLARGAVARSNSRGSDSEGGLAYRDSDTDKSERSSRSNKGVKQGAAPLPTSILRSGSVASTAHVRFPSGDTMSTVLTGYPDSPMHRPKTPERLRKNSTSTISSSSPPAPLRRTRTNSSIIAQALGLTGTPPKDYETLGGPGVAGFGDRIGRSGSIRSNGSARSRSRHPSGERTRAGTGGSPSKAMVPGPQSERGGNIDPPPPSPGAKTHRSNTVQGPHSSPEARTPKLPTRSRTTPTGDRGKQAEWETKLRVCVRCSKKIEDGRWVQCDGGSVLCDMCWKHMYLPKCRRCNQIIEKQAVSSSDGQLKGKYHRECFNCHVCHKSFPDKTFYVFDGKPLCAYHYHEADNSLCSASLCGQPIEGPCAVSHSGDRYHPEHFTCEYPGHPRCSERLLEYWEVDRRMLCERHASGHGRGSVEDDFPPRNDAKTAKAKKRITRFIDLTNGGVDGSDLR